MLADFQTRAMNLDFAVLAQQDAGSARAALRMDESDFHAFYDQTARPLLAYLTRASGDRALAEDLCQEAYCRFLTSQAPAMDSRQSRSYLFQIATNLLRDRWRRPKEEHAQQNLPEPACDPPLDARLGIRQAFSRLKVRERQLLWLAYVEGSTHEEIAESTGLRAPSIRLLLFRARRKLAGLISLKPAASKSDPTNPEVNP